MHMHSPRQTARHNGKALASPNNKVRHTTQACIAQEKEYPGTQWVGHRPLFI